MILFLLMKKQKLREVKSLVQDQQPGTIGFNWKSMGGLCFQPLTHYYRPSSASPVQQPDLPTLESSSGLDFLILVAIQSFSNFSVFVNYLWVMWRKGGLYREGGWEEGHSRQKEQQEKRTIDKSNATIGRRSSSPAHLVLGQSPWQFPP